MERWERGFTLMELMIVVVIVSILAVIAYPSYLNHVRKAARKEALGVMLDAAGRLERTRSQLFRYQTLTVTDTNRYGLSIEVADDGASYTVTATPSGDQAEDPCGVMTLDNLGAWTFTYSSDPVEQSKCL